MIADFVASKMAAYIAGGMRPAAAAQSTRDELLAIYRRQHHSRDKYGAWQITPPPENKATPAAMRKCDAALAEILKCCAESAEKGRRLNDEVAHGKATEDTPKTALETRKRNGLEGLKNYVRRPA